MNFEISYIPEDVVFEKISSSSPLKSWQVNGLDDKSGGSKEVVQFWVLIGIMSGSKLSFSVSGQYFNPPFLLFTQLSL